MTLRRSFLRNTFLAIASLHFLRAETVLLIPEEPKGFYYWSPAIMMFSPNGGIVVLQESQLCWAPKGAVIF